MGKKKKQITGNRTTLKNLYESLMTEIKVVFSFNNSVVKAKFSEFIQNQVNEFIVELL